MFIIDTEDVIDQSKVFDRERRKKRIRSQCLTKDCIKYNLRYT